MAWKTRNPFISNTVECVDCEGSGKDETGTCLACFGSGEQELDANSFAPDTWKEAEGIA